MINAKQTCAATLYLQANFDQVYWVDNGASKAGRQTATHKWLQSCCDGTISWTHLAKYWHVDALTCAGGAIMIPPPHSNNTTQQQHDVTHTLLWKNNNSSSAQKTKHTDRTHNTVFFETFGIFFVKRLNWKHQNLGKTMASNLALELNLIEAVKAGNRERCEQILNQGADVNGADEVSVVDKRSKGVSIYFNVKIMLKDAAHSYLALHWSHLFSSVKWSYFWCAPYRRIFFSCCVSSSSLHALFQNVNKSWKYGIMNYENSQICSTAIILVLFLCFRLLLLGWRYSPSLCLICRTLGDLSPPFR